MKRLILLAAFLLALALGGEAAADHLTWRYTMVLRDPRTQSMAGSVLQIRQSGRTLQGQISGARFNAQVQGETDGGDNARGIIQTQDGQRQYFEAVHGQAGLRMTLIASDNRGQPDRSASLNIQRQGAMDRARIWREAQQEISRIYSQAWQQQQRVQSGLAQQYSQYIRGVETYVDRISGERVELASGHGQAWSNGRGEYILSNDTNFNPSIAFRERWEEMPRLERPR